MQNIAFDRLVSIRLKSKDSHLSRPPSDAANSFFFSLGPKGALERLMTEVGGGDWKGGGTPTKNGQARGEEGVAVSSYKGELSRITSFAKNL